VMKVLIGAIVLFFLIISGGYRAQQILSVNLNEINAAINDKQADFYFDSLQIRYLRFDSTLSAVHYHYIYYSQSLMPWYNPMHQNESQKLFYQLLREREFSEALIHGKLAYSYDPYNLKTLFGLFVCYTNLGQQKKADAHLAQYYGLISAIANSGDGKSITTAFVVNSIDDEYEFIANLRLHVKKHHLAPGPTDVLHVEKTKNSKGNGNYKKLYFNLAIPQLYLQR
jgi:hypothetical protein